MNAKYPLSSLKSFLLFTSLRALCLKIAVIYLHCFLTAGNLYTFHMKKRLKLRSFRNQLTDLN